MPTKFEEYEAHVEMLYSSLHAAHTNNESIDAARATSGLELGCDHKKVRDFAIKHLKIKAAEFDGAIRAENTRQALGKIPQTAFEVVQIITGQLNVTARYNGQLRKEEVPFTIGHNSGEKKFIPPELWDTDDFRALISSKFHCSIGIDDLARYVRMVACNNLLPFRIADLNDATDEWYKQAQDDRLEQVMMAIDRTDYLDGHKAAQASLKRLAETCFDCPHGPDYVVAMFNKFIHQVKSKLHDLPVHNHLMLVILGAQGVGKSTLIRQMLSPIDELHAKADFKAITDDRNSQLWRNFVLFMDEMGYASKADMDTVKNVITETYLTRRIMRTTNYNSIKQNATFIGSANAGELKEMIRDTTGTRRFGSVDMKDAPDWSVINGLDWLAIWQSVDEKAPDPMLPFRAILLEEQQADRTKLFVEEWLDDLDEKNTKQYQSDRKFTSAELHDDFLAYEARRFPANGGTSIAKFRRDLKKITSQRGAKFGWTISHQATLYHWIG